MELNTKMMGQPTHKQYALATYFFILLMVLVALGMLALVAVNA